MSRPIRSLLDRDLTQKIEEIIKVNQTAEEAVHRELSEYVVTDRIRAHYRALFKAIAEAPADPDENVGIWVSGFFGSGKSSFAKNLGYALANHQVLGHPAADLFKQRLRDARAEALLDSINQRIPTEVVMFDVQTDFAGSGSIAVYMYKALLRHLDYAVDFDIADLEQSLEVDDKLEEFERRFGERYPEPWRKRRKLAQRMNEASAILHEMDSDTYPQADSWARGRAGKEVEVTAGLLVEKSFELMARRRPGKALVYIIDEVGAYVARSAERIENLRVTVEQLGKESANRVRRREAAAPIWVLVTSQEKLEEVVTAIDSKRIELPKLQDRFHHRVDLGPSDIREVASQRVLKKNPEGENELGTLFRAHSGQLENHLRFERSSRKIELSADSFAALYPYPPHFLDLSIDVMSGIRLQPGAARHLGGSNRTIIKQAYEMLVSERTNLAAETVGRLVTLDLVFDLVEGNLPSEKQKDISDIARSFGLDGWEVKVAKALALLEMVRDLPRTEQNIAAVLYERVGAPTPLPQVEAALEKLVDAQFVRQTEEGFKLQTQAEKSWQSERETFDPKPVHRHEIQRELVEQIFENPQLKTYRHEGMKSFRVGLAVDGLKVADGQIPLEIRFADSVERLASAEEEAQRESRVETDRVFWVAALTPELDGLVKERYRSREMVRKYDQLRAQGRLSPAEGEALASERHEESRRLQRARERMAQALIGGKGFLRGVSRDGGSLGSTATEVFRGVFEWSVPVFYPELARGSRPLKGSEAEEVLTASNLSGLPEVFYGGEGGLELVRKEGSHYVANPEAPVAREILDFLKSRDDYGEQVTGKDLETRFGGMPYGWDTDLLRMVLATLLRAGAIEVAHQGRRFKDHHDPLCRPPLTKTPVFRTASFAPRKALDLKTLTAAADAFENITGQEADIEEGFLAGSFKKLADEELKVVVPLLATVRAQRLPGASLLAEHQAMLDGVLKAASDDCVRTLAAEGRSLRGTMDAVQRILHAIERGGGDALREAGVAIERLWPVVAAAGAGDGLRDQVGRAHGLLGGEEAYARLAEIQGTAQAIDAAYGQLYDAAHRRRYEAILGAVEEIKGLQEWAELVRMEPGGDVPEEIASLLDPLTRKLCGEEDGASERLPFTDFCSLCRASISALESDRQAASGLRANVAARVVEALQQRTEPGARVERVRVQEIAGGPLSDDQAIDEFLDRLGKRLKKLRAEGATILLE